MLQTGQVMAAYPDWAHVIGWLLMLVSVIQIPIWFIIMTAVSIMEGKCSSWPSYRPAKSWTARREQGGDVTNSTFICKNSSKTLSEISFQSFNPPTMELKLPKVCVT